MPLLVFGTRYPALHLCCTHPATQIAIMGEVDTARTTTTASVTTTDTAQRRAHAMKSTAGI